MASALGVGGSCTKLSLALKPGKPLAIGRIGSMPVLALPDNPVAALVGALPSRVADAAKANGTIRVCPRNHDGNGLRDRRAPARPDPVVPGPIVGHDEQGSPLLESWAGRLCAPASLGAR
jgi:molybdopterin molybdotransferase